MQDQDAYERAITRIRSEFREGTGTIGIVTIDADEHGVDLRMPAPRGSLGDYLPSPAPDLWRIAREWLNLPTNDAVSDELARRYRQYLHEAYREVQQ